MTVASGISAELANGSWAGSLPTSGPGGDYCAQIPGIAGVVLEFVQPLREWFDELIGNPAASASVAAAWEDASRCLVGIPDTVQQARSSLAELDGRTVRALRERHEDLHRVALDAAEWTAATAAALRLASRIVEATRSYVCDALVQLSQFADELFSFSLNPFEIADRVEDFARAAYDLIEATGRLVTDVLEALFALGALLQKLLPIVAEGLGELRQIIAQMQPMASALAGVPFGPLASAWGSYWVGPRRTSCRNRPMSKNSTPRRSGPRRTRPGKILRKSLVCLRWQTWSRSTEQPTPWAPQTRPRSTSRKSRVQTALSVGSCRSPPHRTGSSGRTPER